MAVAVVMGGTTVPASAASSGAPSFPAAHCRVSEVSFAVNGEDAPLVDSRAGDEVVVTFDVPDQCVVAVSFASFVAPEPVLDGSRLHLQARYSRERGSFGPGRHTMGVEVYPFPRATLAPPCAFAVEAPASYRSAPEVRAAVEAEMDRSPVYRAEVIEQLRGQGSGHRGGPGAVSTSSCPSKVVKHSCAPLPKKGSLTFHAGCPTYQIDFAYHPTRPVRPDGGAGPSLIAAVLCDSRTTLCYFTDRVGGGAVVDR